MVLFCHYVVINAVPSATTSSTRCQFGLGLNSSSGVPSTKGSATDSDDDWFGASRCTEVEQATASKALMIQSARLIIPITTITYVPRCGQDENRAPPFEGPAGGWHLQRSVIARIQMLRSLNFAPYACQYARR